MKEKMKYQLAGFTWFLGFVFFLFQAVLLWAHYSATNSSHDNLAIVVIKLLHDRQVLPVFVFLLAGQILSYFAFVCFLWYEAITISESLQFNNRQARLFALVLWFSSAVLILLSNYFLSAHSIFSQIIDNAIGMKLVSAGFVEGLFILFGLIWLISTVIVLISMVINLFRKTHFARHLTALLILISCLVISIPSSVSRQPVLTSEQRQPNIIIVGFDALRPDFLTFFNKHRQATPNFDAFLSSSIVFRDSYTPLARTSPTWASILTGLYPLHHHERDNLTAIETLALSHSLPKVLKKAGYQTVYASDDNVFNNMNSRELGFDRVIGQAGNLNDLLIGMLNDFPLSNLIAMTRLGYYLYPFNYANHSSPQTYRPSDFLNLLEAELQKRSEKPLFLAVHLNMTAYPFYLFHDQQHGDINTYQRYQYVVTQADKMLAIFLKRLEAQGLLKNAIVILLSDHGISLKQPGERMTKKDLYLGKMEDIKKLPLSAYEENISEAQDRLESDTSWGYGSDVLSLTQNHQLFALRFYGSSRYAPRLVKGNVTPMDIKPTLLGLLHLYDSGEQDGMSLVPYLVSQVSANRPLYFESAYTPGEFNQSEVKMVNVLNESYRLIALDSVTDRLFFTADALRMFKSKKQRALIDGDWMLAFYPPSARQVLVKSDKPPYSYQFQLKNMPSYFVLVNLKSGKWTMDVHQSLVKQAPMKSLLAKLANFYGEEMSNYKGAIH